jgi:hypothetical protein
MSRTPLFLMVSLLTIPCLQHPARAQVNPPHFFNPATGELIEQPYVNRNQYMVRDRRLREQSLADERQQNRRRQELAYAADACGLGCDLHEGLQVQGIPGTFVSAVLYKARIEGDDLTLQLRFFNDGVVPARLTLDPSAAPGSSFVQVGQERLQETESKGAIDEVLEPGEIESWWARFPAPPSGATTFDLHVPAVTFRDVPLDDE